MPDLLLVTFKPVLVLRVHIPGALFWQYNQPNLLTSFSLPETELAAKATPLVFFQ